MIIVESFRCSILVTACGRIFFFALFIVLSVTDTDSLIPLALETCATIPQNMNAIFQFWILTHTSAYQNLNYLNCIQRFVLSNKRMFKFSPDLFSPDIDSHKLATAIIQLSLNYATSYFWPQGGHTDTHMHQHTV